MIHVHRYRWVELPVALKRPVQTHSKRCRCGREKAGYP